MRMPARSVVQLLLALIVCTACGSAHSPVATTSATPTASLQPTRTPIPSLRPTPTPPQATSMPSSNPSAACDDTFGFLLNKFYANDPIPGPVGLKVRPESASQPVFELGITTVNGSVVSPDGRRLA